VSLKYATTSGLYRTETNCFGVSDFGRPRTDFKGTIDFSWDDVSGWASGSRRAASTILRFSSIVGTTNARLGVVFDIMLHLASFSESKADDPSRIRAINKRDIVEAVSRGNESNHSRLVILESMVNPDKRLVPSKRLCGG